MHNNDLELMCSSVSRTGSSLRYTGRFFTRGFFSSSKRFGYKMPEPFCPVDWLGRIAWLYSLHTQDWLCLGTSSVGSLFRGRLSSGWNQEGFGDCIRVRARLGLGGIMQAVSHFFLIFVVSLNPCSNGSVIKDVLLTVWSLTLKSLDGSMHSSCKPQRGSL